MPKRNGKYTPEVLRRLTWLREIGYASVQDMADAFQLDDWRVRQWANHLVAKRTLVRNKYRYSVSPKTQL